MGLLGNIIGSVADSVQESSDKKRVEELKPNMMNSAIAKDFEIWFRNQFDSSAFLYSQYNYYDDRSRLVIIDNDCVSILFEIEEANLSDSCVCNFATTLGYKPLSDNGLCYSDGKVVPERILIKTFAEVVRDIIENVLESFIGYCFVGDVRYDDGTDKSGSYSDRMLQKSSEKAFGNKLYKASYFNYRVPEQEQKSAF